MQTARSTLFISTIVLHSNSISRIHAAIKISNFIQNEDKKEMTHDITSSIEFVGISPIKFLAKNFSLKCIH